MKDLLFYVLSKDFSDEKFEKILIVVLSFKIAMINDLNDGGQTVLDVAKFIPGLSSKAAILRKYGARTRQELDHVPSAIGDRIVPGNIFSSKAPSNVALTRAFDVDMHGNLCVVDAFLEDTSMSSTLVARKINDYRKCIGIITVNDVGMGTAFLISHTIVMVSRHCLNRTSLDELKVRFDFSDQDVEVYGLLEDGALMGLDYAILKLKTTVNTHYIPSLSNNREPLQFSFIGYDSEEDLCFSNFTPQEEEYAFVGSHQETFQETDFSFSGSPYFDENDTIYALHQNTGFDKKESLYIAEILERHTHSVLRQPKERWDDCHLIEIPGDIFPAVSFSDTTQYDEGWARGVTLGKNPSIKKDELGKDNLVCQEVLYRWALKGKAKYVGVKTDKRLWIQDWSNWEVFVRKTDGGAREWVKLSTNRQNGKPAIQMGHKLSAVSYWVYGYDPVNNVILKEFFDQYEAKHGPTKLETKKIKYAARYAAFFTPGFRQVEQGNAIVNRQFMYDSRNYCFEWADLNEEHGKAESKKITYEAISNFGAQETDLGRYRTLRNDKATTSLLKGILGNRKADLDILIATNHMKFSRS